MAKLLMEIAGAPPQDLTPNVLDLFSGPGVLWKSWHKLLKYVKDRTNERLDAGSNDDAVATICVVDKVAGAVLDWGRAEGVESEGSTVDGGGGGWVEVGGGAGTEVEGGGGGGGGTELEVGGGTKLEVGGGGATGVGGTYEEVEVVVTTGAGDAMKYLALSPNSEQTVEKRPTSSTIAIRDTQIYVIAANITWKDHKMQPLAQEYQEILPQA
jgi:hypothetical protein